MPMKRDPGGGGTQADGAKTLRFCSFCFQDGQFTQPDITAGEMQAFVVDKLKELHYPGFLAKFLARGIPKLERWSG